MCFILITSIYYDNVVIQDCFSKITLLQYFYRHCLCMIFLITMYSHLNVIESHLNVNIHLKYVSNCVVIVNKQDSSGSLSIRKFLLFHSSYLYKYHQTLYVHVTFT